MTKVLNTAFIVCGFKTPIGFLFYVFKIMLWLVFASDTGWMALLSRK